MSAITPDQPTTVRELLSQRLEELERTEEELAEAARVPPEYIRELLSGKRRPPLPSRTDIYGNITTFLKLGRNDLAACAQAEREASATKRTALPKPKVRQLLMELCEPETAAELERRRAENGNAQMSEFFDRLLQLTQAAVARSLADEPALRGSAERSGKSYSAARLSVLEFLDTTPDMLTPTDVATYFRTRISKWDVDPDAGVLRVVMRGHDGGPRR